MSERREWPVWFDGSQKHITSFPPMNAPTKPDVMVREVLPGDDAERLDTELTGRALAERHAKLVEAARGAEKALFQACALWDADNLTTQSYLRAWQQAAKMLQKTLEEASDE